MRMRERIERYAMLTLAGLGLIYLASGLAVNLLLLRLLLAFV